MAASFISGANCEHPRGRGPAWLGKATAGISWETTPLFPFSGYKSILSPKASWQGHGNHSFSLALDWLRPSLRFWQSSPAPAPSLPAPLRPGLRLTLWTAARPSTPALCSGGPGSSARPPARSRPCALPRREASGGGNRKSFIMCTENKAGKRQASGVGHSAPMSRTWGSRNASAPGLPRTSLRPAGSAHPTLSAGDMGYPDAHDPRHEPQPAAASPGPCMEDGPGCERQRQRPWPP